jgi:hypothetical protein
MRELVRAMLREQFAEYCAKDPRAFLLRDKFERDLEMLVDKSLASHASSSPSRHDVHESAARFEAILDARGRRNALIGMGEMCVRVSRAWRGSFAGVEPVGEILIGAPADATEHDVLIGLALAMQRVVLDSSPIPRFGRVVFEFRGRTVQYGGDPLTDEVACDLAVDLLGK